MTLYSTHIKIDGKLLSTNKKRSCSQGEIELSQLRHVIKINDLWKRERTWCHFPAPNLETKGSSHRLWYRIERLREIKKFPWIQLEQSDQTEKNRDEWEIEWYKRRPQPAFWGNMPHKDTQIVTRIICFYALFNRTNGNQSYWNTV